MKLKRYKVMFGGLMGASDGGDWVDADDAEAEIKGLNEEIESSLIIDGERIAEITRLRGERDDARGVMNALGETLVLIVGELERGGSIDAVTAAIHTAHELALSGDYECRGCEEKEDLLGRISQQAYYVNDENLRDAVNTVLFGQPGRTELTPLLSPSSATAGDSRFGSGVGGVLFVESATVEQPGRLIATFKGYAWEDLPTRPWALGRGNRYPKPMIFRNLPSKKKCGPGLLAVRVDVYADSGRED